MNPEYIIHLTSDAIGMQYLIYLSMRTTIVHRLYPIHHNIYGPSIDIEHRKEWFIMGCLCSRVPCAVINNPETGETTYEIRNKQSISATVKNGYIRKLIIRKRIFGTNIHCISYEGDKAYTSGIVKIGTNQTNFAPDDLHAEPSITILKSVHGQLCHLFFTVKLKRIHI